MLITATDRREPDRSRSWVSALDRSDAGGIIGATTRDVAPQAPVRPDIIIKYPVDEDGYRGPSPETAYLVVYVRPETNRILYEKAILSAVRTHGQVIYLANLNGTLFHQDHILEEHYASQFRFTADPLSELRKHPQLIARFEEHFRIGFADARLIGSFDAVRKLGLGDEELFETIVPDRDFLECWGQSFKRISNWFVVNPNLPAIVRRYTPEADVFVIAVRCPGGSQDAFTAVNHAVFQAITSNQATPVVDGEKLGSLVWSEKIRRTYHISANHLMASFDMADLVYRDGDGRLDIAETPLGRWLVSSGPVAAEDLRAMKRSQLVYLPRDGRDCLAYLPLAATGMTLDGIRRLLTAGWRLPAG